MREGIEKKLQELRVEANMTRMHLELYTGHVDALLKALVNELESIEMQAFKRGYNACEEEMSNVEKNNRDSRHTERSCRETVESDRAEPAGSEESAGAGWYLHGYSYRNPIRPELRNVFVEVATVDDRRLFWRAKHVPWSLVHRWRFIDETDQSMHQDEESNAEARLVPRQL